MPEDTTILAAHSSPAFMELTRLCVTNRCAERFTSHLSVAENSSGASASNPPELHVSWAPARLESLPTSSVRSGSIHQRTINLPGAGSSVAALIALTGLETRALPTTAPRLCSPIGPASLRRFAANTASRDTGRHLQP